MPKHKKRPSTALATAASRMVGKAVPVVDLPALLGDGIAEFERQIGGRAVLIETLSVAESSEDVTRVLCAIADPAYDGHHSVYSLASICRKEHISPGQLFKAFQTAVLVRGQILGSLAAAKAAPAVVDEVVKAALGHDDPCQKCEGNGTFVPEPTKRVPNPVPEKCAICKGTGKLHVEGSLDHQLAALELAGLLKKSGGINIQQNVLTPAAATAGGSLEQLQQAVSEMLYPASTPPTVVEGDVT